MNTLPNNHPADAMISPHLSQKFSRVARSDHPDTDVMCDYYAVFDDANNGQVFCGFVTKKHIAEHPHVAFFELIEQVPQAILHSNTSIEQAMYAMNRLATDALPVVDEKQQLMGIITRSSLLPILYEGQKIRLLEYVQEEQNQITLNKTLKNDLDRANAEIQRMNHSERLTEKMSYALTQEMIDHIINPHFKVGFLAVVCLAVDNFRWCNALYGILVGDCILQEIATRIKEACSDKDILIRQRSDEFIIILPERTSITNLHQEIRKMIRDVTLPFLINNNKIFITISTGVSIYPLDATSTDDLLRKMYLAMHQAKTMGKNNIQYFTPKMGDLAQHENTIREQLHHALKRHEFFIAYQPLYDCTSLELVAVEALLRWDNPVLGLMSPTDFIPYVEEMELITPIGQWVLEEACQQAQNWQAYGRNVRVCINISLRQFQPFKPQGGRQFIKIIEKSLKKSGLSPELLELEITESTLMQSSTLTLNALKKITSLGIRLSCDDFGTGYSSFHRLQQLPLNTIKIDKSLIDNIHKKTVDIAIVSAIIHIAKQLNLQTVAEGVEVTEQVQVLRDLGCNVIQGFYFEKPMSPDELHLILNHTPRLDG